MNKTQVKVYFYLFGDDFPINEVTRRLEITQTESYKKEIPLHLFFASQERNIGNQWFGP